MKIIYINSEEEYKIKFQSKIEDKESLKFSKNALSYHRWVYGFENKPVMGMEYNGEIVAVLFYNLTRKGLSIINLLCPEKYRKRGFAKALIKEAYIQAYNLGKGHVKCLCQISSLFFYDKLNFIYLGKNKDHSLFAYFPLISVDFEDYKDFKNKDLFDLFSKKEIQSIFKRVKSYSEEFHYEAPNYLFKKLKDAASKI